MANTTWNPADLSATTLSNLNLTATPTGIGGVRSVLSVTSGKYYFELTFVSSSSQNGAGVANASAVLAGGSNVANTGTGGAFVFSAGTMWVAGSQGSIGAFAAGAALGIALDMGNGRIWFRNSTTAGLWNNSGTANPATNVGGFALSTLVGGGTTIYALSSVAVLAGSTAVTANFGDSGFVGAVPSGFAAGFPGAAAGVAQARAMVLA